MRQHEHGTVGDRTNLRLGKPPRKLEPFRVLTLVGVTPHHPGKARARGGDRLVASVGRRHLVGAVRQGFQDPVHVSHVGEVFVDQRRPLPAKRCAIGGRHYKPTHEASIDQFAGGKTFGVRIAPRPQRCCQRPARCRWWSNPRRRTARSRTVERPETHWRANSPTRCLRRTCPHFQD